MKFKNNYRNNFQYQNAIKFYEIIQSLIFSLLTFFNCLRALSKFISRYGQLYIITFFPQATSLFIFLEIELILQSH